MKHVLLLFSVGFFSTVFAQKETDFWYFGRNAGMQFTENGPVALENGALSTDEGCSVISSKEGKLLFYTDGITVWNSSHKVMLNGAGMLGDPSSTQSGVCIPRPKHPGEYYLFAVAATGKEAGITYSLIDTRMNGGLGQVSATEKNVQLATPVTEKMTAVQHRNGTDIWVIAHRWMSDEFIAFLVTETGVTKTPVTSKVGRIHDGGTLNTQGYMKANPDGTNLALALEETNWMEMFDFDNSTGKVSNPISVKLPDQSYIYGIEFSPNGSLLYVSAAGTGQIYQFNLQAGNNELIQKSQTLIGQSANKEWIGALQIAKDGKIYFPIYHTSYMGTIEHPNVVGVGCGMKLNTVELAGKQCTLGLPTFTQSFFENTKTATVTYFNGTNVKKGQKLVLKNVQFDFAKSTLKESSYTDLAKVVTYMKANPTVKIALYGHTDNIGNKSSNLTLSTSRANAVKDYLITKGIKADRIQTKGFGSSEPISSNSTDAGRALNRRVEFVVL